MIAWGSYDASKPRVRLLLESLRNRGVLRAEINIPIWAGVRDKSVAGSRRLVSAAFRLLLAYPQAVARLLSQPSRFAILLGYPAIPDIFVVWPLAAIRRQRIIFDAFIPIHDTITGDRELIGRRSLRGRMLWILERAALRLADVVLVDTEQHGDFYAEEFNIDRDKFVTILVGAETIFWKRSATASLEALNLSLKPYTSMVLFYGQLSPLHGISTVMEAAELTLQHPLQWVVVGTGQDEPRLRQFMDAGRSPNVTWIPWVDYDQLPVLIQSADVALGIFGTSAKASRVIPNKLFQVLAAGKAIVTRSSPAVDPLAKRFPDTVITIPAGDAAALAGAVLRSVPPTSPLPALSLDIAHELGPEPGVQTLLDWLAGHGNGATQRQERQIGA